MSLFLRAQNTNCSVPIKSHLLLISLYLVASLPGDDIVQTHIYIIIIITHFHSKQITQIYTNTYYLPWFFQFHNIECFAVFCRYWHSSRSLWILCLNHFYSLLCVLLKTYFWNLSKNTKSKNHVFNMEGISELMFSIYWFKTNRIVRFCNRTDSFT